MSSESQVGNVSDSPHVSPIVPEDRMLKWFAWKHLPEHLQGCSRSFHNLARDICELVPPGPERTVALRKLLEAKDAAVRAVVHPGS